MTPIETLSRPAGGLSRSRRGAGLLVAGLGLPLLTFVLVSARSSLALESMLMIYLLAVVIVAVLGGVVPALLAAVASFLLVNWFLTPPYYTLAVENRNAAIDLVVFVVVAVLVSVTVDVGARNREAATRTRMESRLISRLSSAEPSGASLVAVLEQVRGLFGMDTVALIDPAHEESPLASVGPPPAGSPSLTVEATDRLQLVGYGPEVFAQDRRLLGTLAAIASRAWQGQRLAEQAAQSRQLAETDRVRSALLAAVSHDLRTPLAGIKAAVSGLRQEDIAWTKEEQQDLLRTVEESTDRLTDLISNILAMSRIQAGAVSLQVSPVALDEVVARAMLSLPTVTEAASSADMDADTGTSPQADTGSAQSDSGTSPQGDTVTSAHADTETSAQADTSASIIVDVPEDLPLVLADAGLLERVVANLVDNARRFSPPGVPVRVHAEPPGATGTGPVDSAYSDDSRSTDSARSTDPSDCVRLHITDHGPGIPPSLRDRMFTPFQRLGDQDAGAGLGLGLAIAKGFTDAMHAELIPSVTPGGGLTMTIAIRTVTTEVAT